MEMKGVIVVMKSEKTKYQQYMDELSDTKFKRLIGIKKHTAERFVGHLKAAYAEKHKKRGRHSKLKPEDMLLVACKYWRQYATFAEIGLEFGVAESTAHDVVRWVEDVLIKQKEFHIPGKQALLNNPDIEVVLVDATETPVERQKRGRKNGTPARKSSTL
jgi:hypothetical protein